MLRYGKDQAISSYKYFHSNNYFIIRKNSGGPNTTKARDKNITVAYLHVLQLHST